MSCKVASRDTKNKERVKLPKDDKFAFFQISDFFFGVHDRNEHFIFKKLMILFTYLYNHNLL